MAEISPKMAFFDLISDSIPPAARITFYWAQPLSVGATDDIQISNPWVTGCR